MTDGVTTPEGAAPATGVENPTVAPAAPAASETPAPAADTTILGDAKAEAPAAAATTPFDAEKFTAPEGLELSKEDRTELGDIAKRHGLSSEAMTELLTNYRKRMTDASGAAAKAFHEVNAKWQDEVKADPEIGGDNLPKVLQTIGKVLDNPQFADPKFREALNYTGAGNNPAIVKTFYRMAKALTEGSHVGGAPVARPKPAPGANALYPNLKSE